MRFPSMLAWSALVCGRRVSDTDLANLEFRHDDALASCANYVTGIKHIPVQRSVHGCILSAGLFFCI